MCSSIRNGGVVHVRPFTRCYTCLWNHILLKFCCFFIIPDPASHKGPSEIRQESSASKSSKSSTSSSPKSSSRSEGKTSESDPRSKLPASESNIVPSLRTRSRTFFFFFCLSSRICLSSGSIFSQAKQAKHCQLLSPKNDKHAPLTVNFLVLKTSVIHLFPQSLS